MGQFTAQDIQEMKGAGDAASIGTLVATLMEWLPAVAALVTIVWTSIRIYETKTVQDWIKRIRKKK